VSRYLRKALALLLALLAIGEGSTLAALPQRRPRPVPHKPPPPETSSDSKFNPQSVPKLAVIVAGQQGRGFGGFNATQSDQQRLVEDEFVQALMTKGYSIASRSDVEAIVKEQRFQRSGLTESDAARLGKILNVPAVLVVRITEASEQNRFVPGGRGQSSELRASLGARLVSVESGSVWWIGKQTGSRMATSRGRLPDLVGDVAKSIANAFPDHDAAKKADHPAK
jgi:Curli production assembly/transport component CsgG